MPLVFGVQSLLDWTWFIPAPAVMALIAAGYVAAAGRSAGGGRRREEPAFRRAPTRHASWPAWPPSPPPRARWAIWQPEASDSATNDALALADQKKFDAAIERTKDAEDINPLTPDPLLVRASIDTQDNRARGRRAHPPAGRDLVPGRSQTWYRLAAFQLGTLDAPEAAAQDDPRRALPRPASQPASGLFLNARARLREKTGQASRPSRAARRRVARARASVDPARRSSERTSKPSSSSSRASDRRVKKRRCGESGSACA